jgi:hypothetical protein
MSKQTIFQLIASSFKFQKMMFYGMGIVAALTGVGILIASVAIPPKPGEEQIIAILQGVSVVFILFGVWSAWYVRRRLKLVSRLVFETPKEVVVIKSVFVQKSGVPAFAIRLITKDKKMVGFNVPGPKTQRVLMDLLAKELPDARVEK